MDREDERDKRAGPAVAGDFSKKREQQQGAEGVDGDAGQVMGTTAEAVQLDIEHVR